VLARGCQGPTYSDASCQDLAVTGTALPTSDLRVTPVADQISRNGTADVILGGGLSRFDAADETALKAKGYTVLGSPTDQKVATRADLLGASGGKVFGLFNKGNLTVERYKAANPTSPQAAEPTLAEMTTKAIDLLSKQKKTKGFYLQVEGALIDKRSHANDAAQTLEEMKAFDAAVKVALDFAKKDRNTLVIVTADHECAGFNIIGKGSFTNAEGDVPGTGNRDSGNTANSSVNNAQPDRAAQAKLDTRSQGIQNAPAGTPAVAGGTPANNFAPATFATADDPASVKDGTPEASLWLTYLSGNHTGADVPIFGYGPGSRNLAGSIDNTDLFDIVGGALRLVR
jgi:alkaline phosphatase